MSEVVDIYRRTLPLILTLVVGLIMIVEFFFDFPQVGSVAGNIRTWAVIIFGFSVLFGVANLILLHIQQIAKRISPTDMFFRVWLLIVFFVFLIFGIGLPSGISNAGYAMMYAAIYASSAQAVWSLHAFWITLGTYRTFVAKNREATVLLVSGLLVIVGLAPWGEMIWPGFTAIQDWILNVPLSAGYRGMIIAVALGVIIGSIRTLLAQETGYLR